MTYRAVMFPQGDKPPVGELYYGQDVREVLRCLPAESVHTVVTSPPYWALRNYQGEPTVWGGDLTCVHDWGEEHRNGYGRFCSKCNAWCGQLGLEPTPEMYVANMVAVFREIKRTLRDDGTLWLNIGDTFFAGGSTTAYGQDPRQFDLVVVKSPHCQDRFFNDWAAANFNVDTPGSTSANLKTLGHKICRRPLYPIDDGVSFEPRVEVYGPRQAE